MKLEFQFLDQALWPSAKAVAQYFIRQGYAKILCEKSFSEGYDFRPTLQFFNKGELIIVEITHRAQFHDYFEEFIKTCLIARAEVKCFIAMPAFIGEDETPLTRSYLNKLKQYGVGLLLDDNGVIDEQRSAVKCNVRINLSERERGQKHRKQIDTILQKFNEGDFIDAIRDITELFECVVTELCGKAAKAGQINLTNADVDELELEGKINVLSTSVYKGRSQKKYFDVTLNADSRSYKGTRNLSHHPRNAAQRKQLETQLIERLLMGIRLVKEVSSLRVK